MATSPFHVLASCVIFNSVRAQNQSSRARLRPAFVFGVETGADPFTAANPVAAGPPTDVTNFDGTGDAATGAFTTDATGCVGGGGAAAAITTSTPVHASSARKKSKQK
jgi:hypothetical protein